MPRVRWACGLDSITAQVSIVFILFTSIVMSFRCCCGRILDEHEFYDAQAPGASHTENMQWSISQNCRLIPTNAFGTIEFEGGPHPLKAQYLRVSFDADPADIISHMRKFWKVEPPRLVSELKTILS